MWWNSTDFYSFRQDAFLDVNELVNRYNLDYAATTRSMASLSVLFQYKAELVISQEEYFKQAAKKMSEFSVFGESYEEVQENVLSDSDLHYLKSGDDVVHASVQVA